MMPGNDHYDRNRYHILIGADLADDSAVFVVFFAYATHTHTNMINLSVEGFGV